MMQYLMIENKGTVSEEKLVYLGLSDSRSDETKIGQFGTGAKHGMLCFLRKGFSVVVYSGKTKIEAITEDMIVDDRIEQKICFKIGTKKHSTNLVLGFGELEWSDSTEMACREFFSNALDASGGTWTALTIKIVEKPRAKEGTTRVFVPLIPEVKEYFNQIDQHFLHVKGLQNKRILNSSENRQPRIFWKGVFVREVSHEGCSLFDYNLSSKIDESRTMDDWSVRQEAVQIVNEDKESIKSILRSLSMGRELWENRFSHYVLETENVFAAADELFKFSDNEKLVLIQDELEREMVVKKGFVPVFLPTGPWFNVLSRHESVKTIIDILSAAEKKGGEPCSVPEGTEELVQSVWENCFVLTEMTDGKDCPKVECFTQTQDNEAVVNGFYILGEDRIHLNRERGITKRTIMEEIAHYVSEKEDNTRDFQDFIFTLLCRFTD